MTPDRVNSTSTRRSAGAAWVFLATGLVVTMCHWAGVLGRFDTSIYSVLVLAGFVATIVGIVRNRPRVRWPFIAFAAAVFLFLIGGATREASHTLGDLSSHRTLLPDVITLPGYVFLALGFFGLGRARRAGTRELDALLDAAMAGLAALAVGWVFLIVPTLADTRASGTVRMTLAAYPPLSVFVLVAGFLIISTGGEQRPVAMRLLLGALVFLLVGDFLYMCVDAHVASLPISVADVPYLLANVLFAAMHLHPSSAMLCEPVPRSERPPTRIRLVFVAVALAVPAVIVVARPNLGAVDRSILASMILALTTAATWRVFAALRSSARYEAQLSHQATHDELTGLPNRAYVKDRLQRALARRSEAGRGVALLFLDLDRFKTVNDALGHGTGDDLLIAVSRRLRHVVPNGSVVSRIGGDEFVILLERVNEDRALRFAREVHAALSLPFDAVAGELSSTVSIGIAFAGPDDDVDGESLLRDADIAMYEAKASGRDAIAVFDVQVHERTARRLILERDIRHALFNKQLSLHYQPIIDMRRRNVVGVEALLRWQHPELGFVSPLDFIPVAEETGAIVDIGRWVLRTACEQLSEWRRSHPAFADTYVSVNLSPRQLRDSAFVDIVETTLRSASLAPSNLHIELTESLLVEHKSVAHAFLARLRSIGVAIAIDDFGTGYSSLSYLRNFDIDFVKIDKSFVDDLAQPDTVDESLVAAIVAIARALHVNTVAEGVETPEQAERLRSLEVDYAQGYLFARPVKPDELVRTVARINQLTGPFDSSTPASTPARQVV